MSSSRAWVVTKCHYWIRVTLAIELCVTEGLVAILHNADNDPSYIGLPSDPYQLFQRMKQCQRNGNHALHRVLRQDQWNILCPPNQQQTNSKDWDITLLVAVIRSELKLEPLGGWNIRQLYVIDQSKGAFVYLIRNLRNEIKHGSINDIDTLNKFTLYWNRIEFILKGINYTNMQYFHYLKTESLDPHTIAITKTVQRMKNDVDNLRNVASDNTKYIDVIKKNIDWIKTFLKHFDAKKADKEDLEDLKTDHNNLSEKATSDNTKDIDGIKKNIDWIKIFLKHLAAKKADKDDLEDLETKQKTDYNELAHKIYENQANIENLKTKQETDHNELPHKIVENQANIENLKTKQETDHNELPHKFDEYQANIENLDAKQQTYQDELSHKIDEQRAYFESGGQRQNLTREISCQYKQTRCQKHIENKEEQSHPMGNLNDVKTKSNSLKMERSSNKECLFSVMDINISESSFEFKYKNNFDNQWVEVNQENLKIEVAENLVYFLVKGEFLTGFYYSFIMFVESSNENIVCFGYEDHYVREIIEQSYQDKPNFIAHDDGTKENINVFDIKNLPDEDQQCQGIKKLFERVADFRKASKQHLVDQGELRFPPSYYLAKGVTKQFGDELEKLSPDSYIITGYNPIPHLKLLGFTDKLFKENSISTNLSFENIVTVLAPKKSLILVSAIVETDNAQVVKSELHNLNDILKAVYAAAHKNISKSVMKVIGTLVLPEISKATLDLPQFLFLDHSQHHDNEKESGSPLFLTKEQMKSHVLQIWWNLLSSDTRSPNSIQAIKNVAGEIITSMCIVDSYLPRVTSDTSEKIVSLLLNKDQLAIILDSGKWKFITGPHGSGKSICLKEIARRLYQKKDGVKVVYICYDPFSLLETEIRMFFETISCDGTLQSLSISTISSQAGFSVDQFCNQLGPPEKNLSDLLEYLTKTYGKCHILVDEFHTDNITPQYCVQLKQSLKTKNFQNSTLVVATQSSTTTKHFIIKDVTVLEYEKCSLRNAGMKEMLLEKAMRVPSEIFDLTQTAIDCIAERNTVLSLPRVESKNTVESETEQPPAIHKNIPSKSDITKVRTKSSKVPDNIVAPPAKKRKTDINGIKLADLQYFAKKNNESNANQHSELQLKTNTEFVSGTCGTISSKKKPTLFSLYNGFSILDDKSCRVFAEILSKHVLQTQHRVSFICNDINEITCVAYALKICEQEFIVYAPFLLGQLPSSEERLKVTEQLNTQIGSHLIIDYRSCRGCEFRHCVFFINPKEEYHNHALIEMITRTTSTLTIFVYPYTKSKNSASCLEKVLADWIEEKAIREVKIEVKPTKYKCTIYIGGEEHDLRIERSNLQKFLNVQQYIYKQDMYKKDNALQYFMSSIPTRKGKWDGIICNSFEWNGKTYTYGDVCKMLDDEQFDTLKPMLNNISFVIESIRDDDYDRTLLMNVAWLSHFSLFQFLIPYVQDFNCVDVSGRNVAHYIAFNIDDEVSVEMFDLIKKEMTLETFHNFINKLDKYNESPLHVAAYINNHKMIECLIANGANVNVRNKKGILPDEQYGCDDETKRIIRQHRN